LSKDSPQHTGQTPQWHKKHDILFLLLTLGCLLLFVALFTYDPADVSWSVIGQGAAGNSAGKVGAYLADFLLHSLGYLAFALPALILAKMWMLFRKAPSVRGRVWLQRLSGLLLTLTASCGLADFSIWSGEQLPAGAGGILGGVFSDLLTPLFGFVGTSAIYVIGLAAGLVLFLEFSWLLFFEKLGGRLFSAASWLADRRQATGGEREGAVSQERNVEGHAHARAKANQPAPPDVGRAVTSEKGTPEDDAPEEKESSGLLAGLKSRLRSVAQDRKHERKQAGKQQSAADASVAGGAAPVASVPVDDDELIPISGFSADDDDEILPWEDAPAPAKPVNTPVAKVQPQAEEKELRIEPLEKRENKPSDRAKRDLQGTLFKADTPLPSIALLDPPKSENKGGFSPERLRELSHLLVQKLADFGVKIEVTAVAPGPVITRFEIQPAPGVKASKISNLAKDLARSMAMVSVRVVEVIPGKSVMGIEVPNEDRAVVSLSEVLSSEDYDRSKSPLTLALGHDIAGNPVITDLAKMPHLLVAGTTGSGKSVGVNAMLLSLLFKSTPEELRLILVDPKMLELSVYEGIPHLLTPVITDMKEAASGLRWSVAEMERRYQLMAAMGVRNIAGFNKKVKDALDAGQPIVDPTWQIDQSFETTPPILEPLPYIVIVIDEFADMMMMVGKKVEELIARIAQKARAAGIHMVLATQRPSVDVITGLIKANVPTRIAFQVSSKIDSRTILDQGGAEQLLGHGDMLYMPPGLALPERVHGAFVDDDEVHRVVAEWKLRGEPNYLEEITQLGEDGAVPGAGGGDVDGEQDDLYDQAVAFVTESGKCSISSVQRKLRIGYNRAARLVETMESAGVVSPPSHNGSREVLAGPPPGMN